MVEKTLKDAFYETLKDVYYAERQGIKSLKKAVKQAQSSELKDALTKHGEESAHQVERLTQVFEILGKPARSKTCEAMQGITSEMEEDLEDFGGSEAGDDVLIRLRAGGRALRDRPLWHAEDLGEEARSVGSREPAGRDARGGEALRRDADQDRGRLAGVR